jgi:flagellum-specific ATP synthase
VRGTDPLVDRAITLFPQITAFLRQDLLERATVEDSVQYLNTLLAS